ncbi:lipopolysaccharide transport periplasmic protein LptA [Sulfurimonas marina]|uniref:Lipopolysaccharide transport periplasmic protein LptA n=1 Tax=Sulfurimonas marina TaxID=2590551 RepID=A0A7M1AV04_9BACT|nr:lipopolysaccharide transport periplasmic protein LptA [Sulfurimonas marina]QOP41271.1 lipopolysaccharide transport periplasmic protein LptA [Sulfurimonas marina]
MRYIIFFTLLIQTFLNAEELQIKAKSFYADEKAGFSVFEGSVNIVKGYDELNASKVTVYIDKEKSPTKFIAEGDVSFKVKTKDDVKYEGIAQKAIYLPNKKEYNFYKNVHLKQLGDKKEIKGDEVVLNISDNKAYAKGADKEPVIMIFEFKEETKEENK